MARKKISEFRAKSLLYKDLNIPYSGMSIDTSEEGWEEKIFLLQADRHRYVVKVDQGIKGRKKKGLVTLDRTPDEVVTDIHELSKKGFNSFIVEEFVQYEGSGEHYFALLRTREGIMVWYSKMGGVDIEEHPESITKVLVSQDSVNSISQEIGLSNKILKSVLKSFDLYHFSYLEINPLVIKDSSYYFLDTAVEVDTAGAFFVGGALSTSDYREFTTRAKSEEETAIHNLAEKSQASFSFTILNPNGSVWTLLSGGGASIVVADEVTNLGKGLELANYGEYSGNPNTEETYIYTKNVLSLMMRSSAPKKVLIIGGGVANFTDIRHTFKGVIQALSEYRSELQKSNVKVFVRRGGPHQEEGLASMKKFLENAGLLGVVTDQSMVLTDIVGIALKTIE